MNKKNLKWNENPDNLMNDSKKRHVASNRELDKQKKNSENEPTRRHTNDDAILKMVMEGNSELIASLYLNDQGAQEIVAQKERAERKKRFESKEWIPVKYG
jgi:hypothetical protein